MVVNRELWRADFSESGHPGWPCPTCDTGSLRLQPQTLARADTADSSLNEREGQIETYKARFSCLFVCGSSECGEPVAVTGSVHLQELPNYSFERRFVPACFFPAPQMIRVPIASPVEIRAEVHAAFALFWLDRASSLNRIRNAIELLLTDMGVKRHGVKKSGGRIRLTLDARIGVLRLKKPALGQLCDRMLAVKHLGNAGSHPGEVSRDDVFDGLDILEYILTESYAKPQSELAKIVQQINRRKGPRRAEPDPGA
ncbi:MAG: DUF4145 domain-containing protein [Gemmataceae bacterium]